jgi:hypothetical protein
MTIDATTPDHAPQDAQQTDVPQDAPQTDGLMTDMPKTDAVKTIGAPQARVADALTGSFHLGVWLADEALVERKPEGRIVFWGHDGSQATGRWRRFDSPHAFAWSLTTDVGQRIESSFELTPTDEHTTTVTARGDEIGAPWSEALESLATYLETGGNRREQQRPMIGIAFEPLDSAKARAHGAPIDGAVLISGLAEGGAAEAAGLVSGDVVETVDGVRVRDWPDLVAALQPHKSGDTIELVVWHEGSRAEIPVTLKGREILPLEMDPAKLQDDVRRYTSRRLETLRDTFAGVTDAAAEHRPADGEWCAKEVLQHLHATEQWQRWWAMGAAYGSRTPEWSDAGEDQERERWRNMPLDEALARLESAIRDNERHQRALLQDVPTPPVVRQIGFEIHQDGGHFDEHMTQAREAIWAQGRAPLADALP